MRNLIQPTFAVVTTLFISTILFMTSCKKGDVGPEGPQGPPGIVEVDTFTVTNADFNTNTVYWFLTADGSASGYNARAYTRNNAKITKDILDKGIVQVYFKPTGTVVSTGWQPFPISFIENIGGSYSYNYTAVTYEGKVTLYFYYSGIKGTVAPSASSYTIPGMRIKLVVIPGKTLGAANINSTQLANYSQTAAILGLKD